jgi:hypothetical protein
VAEIVADREKAKLAPKIARGMEAIAKVARLYIKHGKPPSWIQRVQTLDGPKWIPEDRAKYEPTLNRRERRALVRQLNQGQRPERLVAGCKRCGLLYVGKATARCQCPVQRPKWVV